MDNRFNDYNNENNFDHTNNMENNNNMGTVVENNSNMGTVVENNHMSNAVESSNSNDIGAANSANSESVTSTGAPGAIYSYSYMNQNNQERNPNYYERKEEESSTQRTYTTGSYGTTQNQSYTGAETAGQNNSHMPNFNQADMNQQAYTEGNTENQEDVRRARFYQSTNQSNPTGTDNASSDHTKGNFGKKKKQKMSGMKKQHGFGMMVIKCAALALVFGLVSGTVFYGTGMAFEHTVGVNKSSAELTSEGTGSNQKAVPNGGSLSATNVSTATTVTDVSDIVENVMPSIVSITNMGQMEADFFGRTFQQETSSAGSGIIMGQTDDEIYIATNNHVVANSNQLTVNFIDDQQVAAEIKGTDASTDLAVLAVKVKDIPSDTMKKIKVATVGNSDDIKVGQSVVAIGNALGYGQSVTTGVISAVDREVTVQDETTGASITNDLLQTDAAINPGNSGGALLNMNGEVVGINSVKYSDTQVEGMGYSIPISAAEPIINDLITREVVDESNSAFLGVAGQDVTGELSQSFGMPEGLYITMVTENSAAAQAGIKNGDVITEFDGRKIKSMDSLQEIMQYYAAGSEVEVTLQINENGEWKEQKVTVTLGRKNK